VTNEEDKEMGNLLETFMKQAALDAEEQAELISYEDARVVSAESESFGLGQEIWWKPDPATSELGPGTILFRKIDYKLLHKETVNQGPDIMENGSPRSFYGQMVSKVLVDFQGMECLVIPSTITRRGAHSPDRFLEAADPTNNFVSCECDIPTVGPCFDIRYCSCGKPFELGICWICGAIERIPVTNPEFVDPCL
jgi:hypothetical protein